MTGSDFGKNPRADNLTANGDLASGVCYAGLLAFPTGLFFGVHHIWTHQTFESVMKLVFVLSVCYTMSWCGYTALKRSKVALVNLYLRSVIYWLHKDSAAPKQQQTVT